MGKLKPVGSEKLEGLAKINRIMEIAKYNEHIPTPINETKSTEYSKTLSDGANYFIVKEKVGYVIKKGLNESTSDYIEPMKNRKYYNSYSQALKRLNLIAKEVNTNEGYTKNISLFESETEEEKYFLKMPTEEQAQPTAPATAPTPAPAPQPAPAPEEEPMPEPEPEEEPMPEPEMETEPETDEDEEQVTFKTIQKLTGRLGQKIREFLSDEKNQMTSKDVKYVINSVLSALDLNSLDEEDKEEIMMKFEGGEESGMEDMSDIDMGDEEGGMGNEVEGMGDEVEPTPTEMPSSEEMGEEYGSISHRRMGSRKLSDRRMGSDDVDTSKFEEMMETIFSESKVENVLKKYFINEEKTKNHGKKVENTKKIIKKIKTLSESISQEVASRKFVQSNPEANLVGKTKNNNLVFKLNESTVRISPKGNIL